MKRIAAALGIALALAACSGADSPAAAPNEPVAPPPETPAPDETAPQTNLKTGPSGTVGATAAAFTFGCDEKACTFTCRLDGAKWAACESPKEYAGLAEGMHRFEVRAEDAAGNVDETPAERAWIVDSAVPPFAISLRLERLPQSGLDPFKVVATLTRGGAPQPGKALAVDVPRGAASAVTEAGGGVYAFTVTPSSTGIYPVTVSHQDASVTRKALVLTTLADGVGQPMLVPGLVNTVGYEDGITITPDGEYLFVQYGPIYFSGLFYHAAICAEAGWSMYDLTTCPPKTDADLVFDTVGPYQAPERPGFPAGNIVAGKLSHLGITVPTVANRIVLFPTAFYGFRRQADGSFAEPFKVAFNDARGAQGPYGLSFQMLDATRARVVFAWNDYFNGLGDDKPDIYHGVVTMGTTNNLGDVVFSGEYFASITPHVSPVGFASHAGVQGNPHLYYDAGGAVRSIWTDDEQVSHDLAVYRLTAGSFPGGTWTLTSLPAKINTGASESQPFFSGTHLVLNREVTIVAHAYAGAGGADFDADAAWGDAVTLLAAGDTSEGGIFGVGEPTIASAGGKTLLYFAYVENRAIRASGRYDFDLGAAVVEIPGTYGP